MSQPAQAETVSEQQQQRKAQLQQQKKKLMPLVKFLKKSGLKLKHAACQNTKVEYFRLDELDQILETKKQQIQGSKQLSQAAASFRQELYYFRRPEGTQKLKYPQFLDPVPPKQAKFAAFKFQTSDSRKYLFIIVTLIFLGVLFPLWPYELKYALWLLSVAILFVLIGVILVRLVLYVVMASLGVSFWLFPNLFGDYGFIESFKPFYSVQKWQNDGFSIALRVLSFVIFLYYCHSIYVEPEFYKENIESAKQIIQQVHDWGVGKIKGEANFSQKALTMQKILNETADAFDFEANSQQNHQEEQEEQVEAKENQAEQTEQENL